MSDLLAELYDNMVKEKHATSPEYQKAREQWAAIANPNDLDLQDAAFFLEYEWGYLTFLSGIRFGLELGQSLSGMWMNLS